MRRRTGESGFPCCGRCTQQADGDALRSEGNGRIEPITLDVCKQGDVDAARAWVEARVGEAGLHGLVNNAGIAVAGPFEFVPVEDFDRQLQVNVLGQVRVTQAFIPLLRKAHGRITFIGSTGGYFSAPFMSPYSASKYCIEAFTDSLRVELAPWKIKVSVVQPGAIKTPIWDKARADGDDMLKRLPAEAKTLYGKAIDSLMKMVDFTEGHAGAAGRGGEGGSPCHVVLSSPCAVSRGVGCPGAIHRHTHAPLQMARCTGVQGYGPQIITYRKYGCR